jgi:hypothetical protein
MLSLKIDHMKRIFLIPLLAALVGVPAVAQTVHKVGKANIQLVVTRDEAGFRECGVRFVVFDQKPNVTDFYDLRLIALVTDVNEGGFIEGGVMGLTNAQMVSMQSKPMPPLKPGPAPVKFWIAKNTDAVPLTPVQIIPDKDGLPGLMAVTKFEPMTTQLVNIAKGSTMQFSLQYPNQEERVVEMEAALEKKDADVLYACFSGLSKRMEARRAKNKTR